VLADQKLKRFTKQAKAKQEVNEQGKAALEHFKVAIDKVDEDEKEISETNQQSSG